MQLFYWLGDGRQSPGKVHYSSFMLNGQTYNVGDCVYLYPEDEHSPHFVGRIVSAFVDETAPESDPHRIEVKWYERRTSFEPSTKGILESEREVFELEDTDINPIGCISGKNMIVRAQCFDEARQAMSSMPNMDWFFCRGYFLQASNSFKGYTPEELDTYTREHAEASAALASTPTAEPSKQAEGSQPAPDAREPSEAAEEEPAPEAPPTGPPGKRRKSAPAVPASKPAPAKKGKPAKQAPGSAPPKQRRQAVVGTGVCVNCGATSTPQWREGPAGPKTLCNACGVRHVRQQQKKKTGGGGSSSTSHKSKPGPKGPTGAAVATAAVAAAAAAAPAAAATQASQVQTRRGPQGAQGSRTLRRQANQAKTESPRPEVAQPPSKRRRGNSEAAQDEQKPTPKQEPKSQQKHKQQAKEKDKEQEKEQVEQPKQEPEPEEAAQPQRSPKVPIEERQQQVAALRDVLQQTAKYMPLAENEEQLLAALEEGAGPLLEHTAELAELSRMREKVHQTLKEADAAEAAVAAVMEVYKSKQELAHATADAASQASATFKRQLSEALKLFAVPPPDKQEKEDAADGSNMQGVGGEGAGGEDVGGEGAGGEGASGEGAGGEGAGGADIDVGGRGVVEGDGQVQNQEELVEKAGPSQDGVAATTQGTQPATSKPDGQDGDANMD